MKGKIKHTLRRGLPGGPNEEFIDMMGMISLEGYRNDSPDVNNPFNIIPSGRISMKENDGRPLKKGPILGIDNLGNRQFMMPGGEYVFPGSTVFEMPVAETGIETCPQGYRWDGKKCVPLYPKDGYSGRDNTNIQQVIVPNQFRKAESKSKPVTSVKPSQSRSNKVTAADNTTVANTAVPFTLETDEQRQARVVPYVHNSNITQYVPPAIGDVILNRLANPMSTLGYLARGQRMPDFVPSKDNNIDYAFDVINPFAWIDYGIKGVQSFEEGDYLGGTLNTLGAIPALGYLDDIGRLGRSAVNNPVVKPALQKVVTPVVDKVLDLTHGENTPVAQVMRQFGRPVDITDVSIVREANSSMIADNPLGFVKNIASGSDKFDEVIKSRLSNLATPEGMARLRAQEKAYLESIGFEGNIEAQARQNALARFSELKNIRTENKFAKEYLETLKNKNFDPESPVGKYILERTHLRDNAFYKRPTNIVADQYVPSGAPPPPQNAKGINLLKYPQLGGNPIYGAELGVGSPYLKDVPTMHHEIAHVLQRGRTLPIDDELRTAIKPKSNLNPTEQAEYRYFTRGSHGMEGSSFANELRAAMLQRGLIKDIYDPITPGLLENTYKSFMKKPIGLFVENEGLRGGFKSSHRILDFMEPSQENFKALSQLMNKLPTALPVGIGLGAAGAGLSGASSVESDGGETACPPGHMWDGTKCTPFFNIGAPKTEQKSADPLGLNPILQNIFGLPKAITTPKSGQPVSKKTQTAPVQSSQPQGPIPNISGNLPFPEPGRFAARDATYVATPFIPYSENFSLSEQKAVDSRGYNTPGLESRYKGLALQRYQEQLAKQREEERQKKLQLKDYSKSSPQEIEKLQTQLVKEGYNVGVTGVDKVYGENTKAAYKAMVEDDALDLSTIDRYYNKFTTEGPDKRVAGIQSDLVKAGFLKPDQIDGKFGKNTKAAIERYNSGGKEDIIGLAFTAPPRRINDTRCAAGMCKILEAQDIPTQELGMKYVNAWDMVENMNKAGNSKTVYNIYTNPAFKNIKTTSELKAATNRVKKTSQTKADMYKVGDIVGIYYPSSLHHGETLKSKTHNTHVGWVQEIKDGVPIIAHNIEGIILQQPYTSLTTTWIQRPDNNFVQLSKSANENLKYKPENLNVPSAVKNINRFETKIERRLNPNEKEIVSNIINRAHVSSRQLAKELESTVDPNWVERTVFGITGVESAAGINAPRTSSDFDWKRKTGHFIKGKEEEDKSYGVGKIKFNSLDDFSKNYFNINSPADLADDNKSVDVITYNLIKSYENFKDYSQKFPELGLTETDLRNMAVLAHNQGMNKLLKTGRSETKKFLSPKEEVELLRNYYSGTVKDVSATNYRYLGGIGEKVYDLVGDEYEPYISKVNRYASEIFTPPTKTTVDLQKVVQKAKENLQRKEGGELTVYKDYVNGLYLGTPKEDWAKQTYDKLNRIHYKSAKDAGMSVPNYIMSKLAVL